MKFAIFYFQILEKEMEMLFSSGWMAFVIIKPKESRPFWTLKELFKCFDKHWSAVFGLVDGLRNSDKRLFDELSSVVRKRHFWRSMSYEEKKDAVEKAAKLLAFFQNRPYGQVLRMAVDKLRVELLS